MSSTSFAQSSALIVGKRHVHDDPSVLGGEDALRGFEMQAKDPVARLLCADCEFLAAAGPAVLRLKLLEAIHLAESRRLPQEVRNAAAQAAAELRDLIRERPCVSLIDYHAKRAVIDTCGGDGAARFCDRSSNA
jgi:hypothetical protein